MTAGELIEELKQYDPTKRVYGYTKNIPEYELVSDYYFEVGMVSEETFDKDDPSVLILY